MATVPSLTVNVTGPVYVNLVPEDVMATLAEIQSAIADLQTTASTIDSGLDAVKTEIDALKAQVAAGGAVSEADLDGVLGSLQGVQTTLADAMTKESGL